MITRKQNVNPALQAARHALTSANAATALSPTTQQRLATASSGVLTKSQLRMILTSLIIGSQVLLLASVSFLFNNE